MILKRILLFTSLFPNVREIVQVLEHLAELRGEEATLSEFPKEDLAKYLSPADLHVLEDPRESPSRFKTIGYLPCNLKPYHSFHLIPMIYSKLGKEVSYLE